MLKKINKEAIKRVYAFFKSKFENITDLSEGEMKCITDMIYFLDKNCKEDRNVSKEEEESDDNEEDKENHPEQMEIETTNERLRPPQK